MPPPQDRFLFKVVLIGNSGVGKTSVLRALNHCPFEPQCLQTIGIDFVIHRYMIQGERVKLQIWDTSGQERFRTITRSYYRSSGAVLLVFSLDDRDTFHSLREWHRDVLECFRGQDEPLPLFYVVGTKSDIVEHRVTSEEGKRYAEEIGGIYAETSAKEDLGVDEVFRLASLQLVERAREVALNMYQSDTLELQSTSPPTRSCNGCLGTKPVVRRTPGAHRA